MTLTATRERSWFFVEAAWLDSLLVLWIGAAPISRDEARQKHVFGNTRMSIWLGESFNPAEFSGRREAWETEEEN